MGRKSGSTKRPVANPQRLSARSIRRYVESTGITKSELARRVGITPSYMSDLVSGRIAPGRRTAARFVIASGGALRLEDLIELGDAA